MIFQEENIEIIRKRDLEWHLAEVKIYQSSIEDRSFFQGYGVIKINQKGGLYLDFICKESNQEIDCWNNIPQDPLDAEQVLHMEAVSLEGHTVTSTGFSIAADFDTMVSDYPKLYRIDLGFIDIKAVEGHKPVTGNYYYFQFSEKVDIPRSLAVTTDSSNGGNRWQLNTPQFVCESLEVTIVKKENFAEAIVVDKNSNAKHIESVLLFYLGMTSGVYIQPYYKYKIENKICVETIQSIDSSIVQASLPPPTASHGHLGNEGREPSHFEIFRRAMSIASDKKNYFDCMYAQWKRIWFSMLSSEPSVQMLTISIAIEGVVNDIFIPEIGDSLKSEELERVKEELVGILENTPNISEAHIKQLKKYVCRWGNIYPKKVLQHLSEKEVIENYHLESWEQLRHMSVHPRNSRVTLYARAKDIDNAIRCLGLFYRLILNVLSYEGSQFTYKNRSDPELRFQPFISVLNE